MDTVFWRPGLTLRIYSQSYAPRELPTEFLRKKLAPLLGGARQRGFTFNGGRTLARVSYFEEEQRRSERLVYCFYGWAAGKTTCVHFQGYADKKGYL
ncbi:MAG: hypothetical protein IT462_10805 [Planctomycetes bacterium]|nr:hypothetical protein [Planctomycetota bacterium]